MSLWFRFYAEAINDPKLLKLSDELYRAWVGLLCVASKNDGILPPAEDIALMLRKKLERVGSLISSLRQAGLIDETERGLVPHNWNARQYKSDVSTERVKRFRNAKTTVSETSPDTEADTETEKKAERGAVGAARRKSSRLEPDWVCSSENSEFARKHGLSPERIGLECEKFRNYWTAKSGRDAAKLDWNATWRNWILNALERGGPQNGHGRPTADRSASAGADRVLERLKQLG